jgi:hypothetical protein
MNTLSFDTNSKVEQLHIKLLRKASLFRRLQIVVSLTKTTHQLSWQGICERYASESVEARLERFISFLYEDKLLARRVVDALANKGKSTK